MSGIIKAQTTCRWDVEVNRYLLPIAQVWKSIERLNKPVKFGGLRFKSGWEYDGCGSLENNTLHCKNSSRAETH